MRAIVTGMIATYPVGGVAWDYGQYLLGLLQLGFEVYYLEDTGGPTYDPEQRQYSDDYGYGIKFLRESLTQLSPDLADRWYFRSSSGDQAGIEANRLRQLFADADLFLNVSGGTLLRDEYMPCRCKVLIDTDPGWNHFVNYPRWDAQPGWQGTHGYRSHDHFFTYAERLGKPDCLLPNMGLSWRPTRPPVVLNQWESTGSARSWTTVMTWDNFRRPVEYHGQTFGTKEMEFAKIEDIPTRRPTLEFELATGGSGAPAGRWRRAGWTVIDSHSVSETMHDYRDYIQKSRAELSVAKNLYVATRSGWFSCRSACYLAAGRPVVVQDTGFSEILPTGLGLLAFSNQAEADAGISEVEGNYSDHQRYARDVASEYLDSKKVLGSMLQNIGLR
jgi:hypothetical protein